MLGECWECLVSANHIHQKTQNNFVFIAKRRSRLLALRPIYNIIIVREGMSKSLSNGEITGFHNVSMMMKTALAM